MTFASITYDRKYFLPVTFCCLILICGCSALQDLARSIQKPDASVTDMQVTGFDFSGIDLLFEITVDNPNAVSLQLLSYDYNLDINERTFVSGNQEEETRIEASGESTFRVPVRLGYSEVYSTVASLAGSDSATYEFMSRFQFDLPGLGVTEVPVRREGHIPLLRIPKIRISALHVDEVNFNSADLTLVMEFENPNGLGFDINDFDYSLEINGTRWAEGRALEDVSIPENGVATLNIPVQLNITQMGLSAYRLLTGSGDLDYRLNGNFSLGANHPLLGTTSLKINREGQLNVRR